MKKILCVALLVSLSSLLNAFDKRDLEINLRKSLNLTTKQNIVVGDPQKSDFAGLQLVQVSIDGGAYPVYLAPDEKQYFWGTIFNMAIDPDQVRASKITLTNVRAHGSAKAPVTVVEFTDLQCPYCKKAHAAIKEALYKDFKPEQVRLVFKHFPLSMHKWAEDSAMASECAALQKDKYFWDMTSFYYDQQESLKPENFKEKTAEIVTKLKLDKTKFDQCMTSKATLGKVNADRSEGVAVGVGGTPSFYVNGRMLRGTDYQDLRLLINEKLAEKK